MPEPARSFRREDLRRSRIEADECRVSVLNRVVGEVFAGVGGPGPGCPADGGRTVLVPRVVAGFERVLIPPGTGIDVVPGELGSGIALESERQGQRVEAGRCGAVSFASVVGQTVVAEPGRSGSDLDPGGPPASPPGESSSPRGVGLPAADHGDQLGAPTRVLHTRREGFPFHRDGGAGRGGRKYGDDARDEDRGDGRGGAQQPVDVHALLHRWGWWGRVRDAVCPLLHLESADPSIERGDLSAKGLPSISPSHFDLISIRSRPDR